MRGTPRPAIEGAGNPTFRSGVVLKRMKQNPSKIHQKNYSVELQYCFYNNGENKTRLFPTKMKN